MIAVTDTSPLLYLVWTQYEQLLPRFFDKVLVPAAVVVELQHPNAPDIARSWIASPPDWVEVRVVPSYIETPKLGPGELSAIALALDSRPCQLLMDDRDGVAQAKLLGISTVGTLGVLLAAAHQKWISLGEALAKLRNTSFRMSESLAQALLSSVDEVLPP